MALFSKGKGGRSSKLTNIGHGVRAVHKLRKLHAKYEMLHVRCHRNFIIQMSEVPFVSVWCVMTEYGIQETCVVQYKGVCELEGSCQHTVI
jgi:hypothetical protein